MTSSSWDTYFEKHIIDFVHDGGLKKQLLNPDRKIFSANSNTPTIHDVVDGAVSSPAVTSESSFSEAIATPPSQGIRIISVYSERTIAPLKISSSNMSTIFEGCDVIPEFLAILLSFGDEPHLSEASSSHIGHVSRDNGEYVLFYKLNFIEENQRGGHDPWSFRHVGMYHHHKEDFDLFIILHCTRKTAFYPTLSGLLAKPPKEENIDLEDQPEPSPQTLMLKALGQHPEKLHSLLLSSYCSNWKPYFRHLGERFSKINDKAMVDNADQIVQASFPVVRSLRNTNDFALFASACCANNVDILEQLSSCAVLSTVVRDRAVSLKLGVKSCIENSKSLQSRIANLIELVGYTLTLHNQLETGKLDKEVRDMTKKLHDLTQTSVDDSAIVRVITVVSAIYLPGSFVGSIFGMNFFVFDSDVRKIVIGHDFWIFVLIWALLTGATCAFFYLVYWQSRRKQTALREKSAL